MSFRRFWDLPDDVPPGWGARRRLAAALRGLGERCVDSDATEAQLRAAAEQAEALLAALAPGKTSADHWQAGTYDAHVQELIDRTALVGQSNPLAPPLRITHDG